MLNVRGHKAMTWRRCVFFGGWGRMKTNETSTPTQKNVTPFCRGDDEILQLVFLEQGGFVTFPLIGLSELFVFSSSKILVILSQAGWKFNCDRASFSHSWFVQWLAAIKAGFQPGVGFDGLCSFPPLHLCATFPSKFFATTEEVGLWTSWGNLNFWFRFWFLKGISWKEDWKGSSIHSNQVKPTETS